MNILTSEIVTVRLPRELRKEIEEIARIEGKERSEVIRELLIRALREKKLERALELYRKGKITLWRAARISSTSLWEIVEELQHRRIEVNYGLKELEEDYIEALREDQET